MPAHDLQVLALLLASAVLEEVIFRLGIHESLLQRFEFSRAASVVIGVRVSVANAITASLFALAHALFRSWTLGLAVVPAALALGWVYERYRRVWPCIALHALMNLGWFVGFPG